MKKSYTEIWSVILWNLKEVSLILCLMKHVIIMKKKTRINWLNSDLFSYKDTFTNQRIIVSWSYIITCYDKRPGLLVLYIKGFDGQQPHYFWTNLWKPCFNENNSEIWNRMLYPVGTKHRQSHINIRCLQYLDDKGGTLDHPPINSLVSESE